MPRVPLTPHTHTHAAAQPVHLQKLGPREFHAGNRVPLSPYKRGISDGTQFMDPWRNPYLVRGVPQEQSEMSRPLNEVCFTPYMQRGSGISIPTIELSPNRRFWLREAVHIIRTVRVYWEAESVHFNEGELIALEVLCVVRTVL